MHTHVHTAHQMNAGLMAQEIEAPSLAVKEEGTERISPSHLMWCALWCIFLFSVCIEIQINVYKPKKPAHLKALCI